MRHVETIGRSLALVGVRRDDVVAVVLPNGIEIFLTFLGIASVAACAPLNPASTRSEVELYLGELRPRALVVEKRDCAAAAVAREMGIRVFEYAELRQGNQSGPNIESAESGDTALVLFTSATTDRAKAVPLTHGNLAAMVANTQRALRLTESDRFLSLMPLFHLQGLMSALAQVLAGGSVVFTGGFAAGPFETWIRTYAPTWYTAGPALHTSIVAAPWTDPGRLRFVRSIGARMEPQLMADLERKLGVPVLEGYGLTETGLVTSNEPPPGRRKPGSVGKSCGPDIAVMDVHGARLGPQQEGEIAVRGPCVMRGYRENEVATRNAFRDGWFLTGDLGRLDEEGFLYVTGRIKEMINRGGEKVLPTEIDEVLMAHPAVKKAAAFGRPHPTLQEDVAAAVVLHAGAEVSEQELRSYAAGQLALYKVPRRIFFVDSIPVGPTGKVRRGDLANQVMASVDSPVAARTELESRIADIWRRLLNVERVGVRDNFFELGGDSLAVTLMMAELETELGASAEVLDQTKFFESPEISTLADLLGGESAVPVRPQRVERPPFVVLQSQGGRIPFFCVPGADENPYYFRELAQELGEDQPFYIVRDPRPMAYRPSYTVEEVAARFIEQLSTIQRTGPYLIGGHCFGGVVAYEMARQLVARSETVGRVVMFEAPAPGYPKVLRHWKRYGQTSDGRAPRRAPDSYFGLTGAFDVVDEAMADASRAAENEQNGDA